MNKRTMWEGQWEAKQGVGKNLCSPLILGKQLNNSTGAIVNSGTSACSEKIYVDFSINSTYVISGLETSLRNCVFAYAADGTFVGRTSYAIYTSQFSFGKSAFANGSGSKLFDSIAYIIVQQFRNSGEAGDIQDALTAQIQVEVGDTPTAFEPYNEAIKFENCKGGYFSDKEEFGLKVVGNTTIEGEPSLDNYCPLQSLKKDSKIKVSGKNLQKVVPATIHIQSAKITGNSDGTISITGTTTAGGGYAAWKTVLPAIEGKAGKTYVFSGGLDGVPNSSVRMYTDSGQTVAGKKITLTEDSNLYVGLNLVMGVTYDSVVRVQVEEASAATPYEPYFEPIELTVPTTLYEGDIWYPSTGKVVRNTMLYEPGTVKQMNIFTNYWPNQHGVYIVDVSVGLSDRNRFSLCSTFKHNTVDSRDTVQESCYGLTYGSKIHFCFCFKDVEGISEITTSAELKTFMTNLKNNGTPTYLITTRNDEDVVIEDYTPQPIPCPPGTIYITQEMNGTYCVPGTLSATMLVRK